MVTTFKYVENELGLNIIKHPENDIEILAAIFKHRENELEIISAFFKHRAGVLGKASLNI